MASPWRRLKWRERVKTLGKIYSDGPGSTLCFKLAVLDFGYIRSVGALEARFWLHDFLEDQFNDGFDGT